MAADFNTAMQLENELWHFALDFYSKPEVEKTCLRLQDEYGLSVNRVIFSCWCGLQGVQLNETEFQGEAAEWQSEITHPLRALRNKVRKQKELFPECYRKLRQAELSCEQVELSLLYILAEKMPRTERKNSYLSKKNLQTYLKIQNLPIDKEITQYVSLLIGVLNEHYVAK